MYVDKMKRAHIARKSFAGGVLVFITRKGLSDPLRRLTTFGLRNSNEFHIMPKVFHKTFQTFLEEQNLQTNHQAIKCMDRVKPVDDTVLPLLQLHLLTNTFKATSFGIALASLLLLVELVSFKFLKVRFKRISRRIGRRIRRCLRFGIMRSCQAILTVISVYKRLVCT